MNIVALTATINQSFKSQLFKIYFYLFVFQVVIQPDTVYERVQYQFEEEPFDTVPDLITYYVGNGKPVTAASKARIQFPCNRLYPLSWGRWETNAPPKVPDKKRSLSLAPEPRLTLSRIDDRSNSAEGVIQETRWVCFKLQILNINVK